MKNAGLSDTKRGSATPVRNGRNRTGLKKNTEFLIHLCRQDEVKRLQNGPPPKKRPLRKKKVLVEASSPMLSLVGDACVEITAASMKAMYRIIEWCFIAPAVVSIFVDSRVSSGQRNIVLRKLFKVRASDLQTMKTYSNCYL